MAVSSADVRVIVERVCARPEVLDACAERDLGGVRAEVKARERADAHAPLWDTDGH